MITYSQSTLMTGQPEGHPRVFIPTVYEDQAAQPMRWKYHVLVIDTREQNLPGEATLNELGQEGWILVGLLDERATGRDSKVHYYFARHSDE